MDYFAGDSDQLIGSDLFLSTAPSSSVTRNSQLRKGDIVMTQYSLSQEK